MDASLVSLISFVIFIGVFIKYGYQRIVRILDAHISATKHALTMAHDTKEEAASALHEHYLLQEDVTKAISVILTRAQEEAETLKKKAFQDLEELMINRKKFVDQVMERLQYQAVQDIKDQVATLTIETVRHILQKELSSAKHKELNQLALQRIGVVLKSTLPAI